MDSQILKFGQKIKPELTLIDVQELIENNYGLKVNHLQEIKSFDDRNYLVTADSIPTDSNGVFESGQTMFTFKVTNTLDTSIPGLIEGIGDISLHVQKSNIVDVPCPILDKNNKLVSRIKNDKGDKYAIRLMTFIPGTIFCDVTLTAKLLVEAGIMVANITKCLEKFSNSAIEKRTTLWSLYNVPKLKPFMRAIVVHKDVQMIEDIISKFEQLLIDKLKNIKKQIIHGDLNEQNIVVDYKNDEIKIVGLLDFGDVHFGPALFDLSIFCSYMTIVNCSEIDALAIPAYILAGYSSVINIREEELVMIPTLIMARLAQSLVLGAYSYSLDPNNEYLLSSARNGWKIIRKFYETDCKDLISKWKHAKHSLISSTSTLN